MNASQLFERQVASLQDSKSAHAFLHSQRNRILGRIKKNMIIAIERGLETRWSKGLCVITSPSGMDNFEMFIDIAHDVCAKKSTTAHRLIISEYQKPLRAGREGQMAFGYVTFQVINQ